MTSNDKPKRSVAYIQEDCCVGCTKCLDACPVDAIVGSLQWMHTIIEAECIGCRLCIPVCPVDCIELRDIATSENDAIALKEQAKMRVKNRKVRLEALEQANLLAQLKLENNLQTIQNQALDFIATLKNKLDAS